MIGCSALKSFTTVIFYYVGQKPPVVQWRKREKRGDKEHHEKVRFFHLAEFQNGIFCFIFEKTSSLPMQLVMLFVQVGKQYKRNNSQKQPFTDVLQNSCS